MSKASATKRQAKRQKGCRRLRERGSREDWHSEKLNRWLEQFPGIADFGRFEDNLGDLALDLARQGDPRSGEALQFLRRFAANLPMTNLVTGLVHMQNGELVPAWMALTRYLEKWPTHRLAEAVRAQLPVLEEILEERGRKPAQAVLWHEIATLVERRKFSQVRDMTVRLLEQWPEDREAAKLLAHLSGEAA